MKNIYNEEERLPSEEEMKEFEEKEYKPKYTFDEWLLKLTKEGE